MMCIGGPLDGLSMPDFGTMYFAFSAYDKGRSQGPLHVYRRKGETWVNDEQEAMEINAVDQGSKRHGR